MGAVKRTSKFGRGIGRTGEERVAGGGVVGTGARCGARCWGEARRASGGENRAG